MKGDILLNPLGGNSTLTILLVDPGLLLFQVVQRVSSGDGAEQKTEHPAPVRFLLQPLGVRALADVRGIQEGQGIKGQVAGVSQLSANSTVLNNGVEILGVGCHGRSLEVLNVLAQLHKDMLEDRKRMRRGETHAHGFADEAELLFDSLPGSNLTRCGIGTEEVPSVEAREVLQSSKELVAAGGRGYELEVMRHRWVVHKSVGNHSESVWSGIGELGYYAQERAVREKCSRLEF